MAQQLSNVRDFARSLVYASHCVRPFQKGNDLVHAIDVAPSVAAIKGLILGCFGADQELRPNWAWVVSGLAAAMVASRPEATQSDGEAMQSDGEATQSDGEATQPVGEAIQPVGEASQPVGKAMQPEAAQSATEAAQ